MSSALETLAQLQADCGLLATVPPGTCFAAELRARVQRQCDELRAYLIAHPAPRAPLTSDSIGGSTHESWKCS